MKNILITLLCFIFLTAFAQDDKTLTESTVNQPTIKSHIGFLASDALRGRNTPSPELDIAAEYIKSRFVEYGVLMAEGMDSYFQGVPMKNETPPKSGSIQIDEDSFNLNDDFIILNGSGAIENAGIVFANYGLEEDLKKLKVEGNIVFALAGDGESQDPRGWFVTSTEKRKKVKEMGGVALVELYNSSQIPWNMLVRFMGGSRTVIDSEKEEEQMPHLWMNRSLDDLSAIQEKKKTASLTLKKDEPQKFVTKNVIGYIEGTDPELKNEFVVYSAHYDHVGVGRPDAKGDSIYNGARDNAAGTVTVLSAAQNIAKYPTKRSALFVLFTGEEKGLLGSRYFVDNSPVDLSKMVYCFNSDNGGYNDTSIATIIGLTRTTAGDLISEACKAFGLNAIEDPAPEQGLFDRSDNVRFASKGIPAPTFSLGFTAFDAEIGKYYHQPGDEPETLDYDYLEKFFKAYVLACRGIANSDEAPFWIEGDKYYEEGMKLYDK
ncbi:MAG: M28 family peptidase [Cyclobacteriaceae bacterium]